MTHPAGGGPGNSYLCAFAVLLSPNIVTFREDFNAEDAKVSAEERGGRFSLRPLREPLRPLRLIGTPRSLVAAVPRCVFAPLRLCFLASLR